jgi:hypothetical protein
MRILVLAAILLSARAAFANERPYTPRMTCASIQMLVASRGAIALTTRPFLYGRFVRDETFCLSGPLSAQPEFVAAADKPYCLLYTCKSRSYGNKE